MGKLTGKVALVTGAGSGLGKAIAKTFAQEGATVILTGRNEDKLRLVEQEIGGAALVLPADMTQESQVQALFHAIEEQTKGQLDIVVNNVGGVNAMGTISDMPFAAWQKMNDLNLTSQFLTTKYALPLLRKSGNGKLIAVTSGMANFFVKGMGAYSASKAGVEGLMKTVAVEEAANGIQVNLFDPINAMTESNPQGKYDPMDLAKSLIDVAAASTIVKQGEIIKPTL